MLRALSGLRRASPLVVIPSRAGSSASHAPGAHGHHDAGLSAGAAAYEKEIPRLWGAATPPSGAKPEREEWELPFYFTAAGVGLLCVAAMVSKKPTPHAWAREEVEERERRRLAGKDVVRGVNYAGIRLLKEAGDISDEYAEELEGGLVVSAASSKLQSTR